MVVARIAQARSVKVSVSVRPPMVGRVMNEDVPQVAGNETRRRRGSQVKSKYRPGRACNDDYANQYARPSGCTDQFLRRMMVALVDPREDRGVMKKNAMQPIFDQCPSSQPRTEDNRPDHGLRRDQAAKRKQRGDENERGKKKKLEKIAELAHLHGNTPRKDVRRPQAAIVFAAPVRFQDTISSACFVLKSVPATPEAGGKAGHFGSQKRVIARNVYEVDQPIKRRPFNVSIPASSRRLPTG